MREINDIQIKYTKKIESLKDAKNKTDNADVKDSIDEKISRLEVECWNEMKKNGERHAQIDKFIVTDTGTGMRPHQMGKAIAQDTKKMMPKLRH